VQKPGRVAGRNQLAGSNGEKALSRFP